LALDYSVRIAMAAWRLDNADVSVTFQQMGDGPSREFPAYHEKPWGTCVSMTERSAL
jgi:hypothetical protein